MITARLGSRSSLLSVALAFGGVLVASSVVAVGSNVRPPAEVASTPVTPPPTEPVVAAETWELRFRPGPLRVYIDPITGEKFWYFTYTVSNRTGRERSWSPRFELHSDAGLIQRSGEEVPLRVSTALRRKLQVPRGPELFDQNQVIGPLLPGEQNAREAIVIWPLEDDRITALSIYVSGVTSRRERLHGFAPEPVELRQTRRLRYLVPGDLDALRDRPIELVSEDWVYR
jgi:hypothetical protein